MLEFERTLPDEDALAAEAFDVISHAIYRAKRGGRRGGRGRQPSMNYSASRSRNPRECLKLASKHLGFQSVENAKAWIGKQPCDESRKLDLKLKPKPRNIEGLEIELMAASVALDSPTRLQRFLSLLNEEELIDIKPIPFGIRDAEGKRSKLLMKIISDPRPEDKDKLLITGRLLMKRGQLVHCLDDQTYAIFPGHLARIQIDPAQELSHVEFLSVVYPEGD